MSTNFGVLLPVRIETRFLADRLRLRVVPDEPWYTRHDPRVSEGELAALQRYLDALASAADDAARRQAWRELVAHTGGARAVFLVRTFVVPGPGGQDTVRPPTPDEQRTEPALPRIEGFPDELHVWVARDGSPPKEVLTLAVRRDRLLADFPDPDAPADRRWWEDWDEAVAAGLAGEIEWDPDARTDALFVTGLGDGDPASVFASHRDEGRLGLLAPGTATNTVDGAPAAPLGQDPDTWFEVLHNPASETDRLVSLALTGDPGLLGNLPGPSEPQRRWNSAMVSGLWPALWGFAADDLWAVPGSAEDASAWAERALFPEGPFPTLRVGPQPYGLLPATVLARWAAASADPPVEAGLRAALLELRQRHRQAAEARGTVAGASTEEFLDLLAQVPTSQLFRHRRGWPLELWWLALLLVGFTVPWLDLDQAWRARYELAARLGLRPVRRYGAVAASRRLDIPLIVPAGMPEGRRIGDVLHDLVARAREQPSLFAATRAVEDQVLGFPPDSLLLRLAIRALQVAIGDVGRQDAGEKPPGPEPVARDANAPGRLATWISTVEAGELFANTPAAVRFRRVAAGLGILGEADDGRLERLLTATVDTATHRLDPWLLGAPTRRLDDLLDAGAVPRLGAYGWVDDLGPGTPGPTPAGLLHAPSARQAMTATVLRDRAVNDPAAARWDLYLTSRSVRDADRLAEQVRLGAHLAEALGREVERLVTDPQDVARLRRDFPARTEHVGRRVCDGVKVLAAPAASLGLDPPRLAALDRLRTALDAYGDLLVAEAVHHVTEGRAEVAGAVMDAAAGFARPPQLGLLRTPREGRALATSVVALLRDMPEPPLPADPVERATVSPASLADAATAAFLHEQAGEADEWTFEVATVAADGSATGPTVTVTLLDLDLLPADALALSLTDLERLAAEAGAVLLGVESGAVVGGDGRGRYEGAARLVQRIGRAPAGPDALTEQADAVVDASAVDADLLRRYTLVHETAAALVQGLADQLALTAADGGLGGADELTLRRLVAVARSWGVAPDLPPDVAVGAADPVEATARRLVAAARRARELLELRLASAPPPPGPPLPPGTPHAGTLVRDDLVAALTSLATPTGQLAVSARLPRASLPDLVAAGQAFDEVWLPVVAAVRPPLARVEVHQLAAPTPLGSGPPLVPWTNKPGDPWQADAGDGRRMIVAYAPGTLDVDTVPSGARVAVAALDRFTEVVPAQEQTTGAAFGFDAPAARAPQAILLAIPPDPGAELDARTVVEIVADTRELAHARMARPADLDPAERGMLPTSLLPASGQTAVPLDPNRT
jgi:hypothetical protein